LNKFRLIYRKKEHQRKVFILYCRLQFILPCITNILHRALK